MKKSFKLTTLFTLIVAFFASLVLSISLYLTPAKAASDSVFQMEYGASVQLSKNGLRFKAKMSKDYYDMIVTNDSENNVLLYGYIAPVQEFDKGVENLDVKVGGELDENKIYQGEDGYYYANIVMTNLDTYTYQDDSFSAIAFIEDKTSGSAVYTYAELALDEVGHINIEAQNRTQYDIVNAAFLDGEESYESRIIDAYGNWYGTAEYPIAIETETEYQAFVTKLEDAGFKAKIEGKHVFIKEGLTADIESVVSVTKTTGHIVTFWDGNKVVDVQFVADGGNATLPTITKEGYNFVEWVGATTGITQDENVYAKWTFTKGEVKDIGDMAVYGVTLASGSTISQDSDVLGQKVILASGYLVDGAYYPGETDSIPDPTDENNSADQAYLAYDGSYGFNDYFVADFTGKNMPTVAFFANNYNNSMFYGDGTKNGVVVSTGLTWPDGRLFTEDTAYCTSVFNGAGLCMWGPHMIYSTAKNNDPKGVLLHSNVTNVALGRANLVDGTQYRVIMGMQPGDDLSNKAIKLVYNLYNLDTNELVESQAINTYNFFADDWANAGQTRDEYCSGSIVAYGYFGTPTVLDKTYPIYEDTTIGAIATELGMLSTTTLAAGSIGSGANYTKGQNAGGSITQSYYAINGDYSFGDYLALDFTGKNMPEVMFFADNYDTSMYYSEGKQGVVVASGITFWDGSIGTAQTNNTKVGVSGPFGAYFESAAEPTGGNMMSDFAAKLARANLVDGTQYRVIMGIKRAEDSRAFTLEYTLYDLTNNTVVEEVSQTTWNFFTGSNAAVGNLTLDGLSGAIVLYGKFGTTCTIDKLHGVFEDTDIATVANVISGATYTVTFNNYDGSELATQEYGYGETPVYEGTPARREDGVASYVFAGWDKEITKVTESVTYTATYSVASLKENVTTSTSKAVTIGNQVVLASSGIGDGANYTQGQQYDSDGGTASYVHQSYLAFDGNYALNDYVAFDFTGKNLPEIAFFANNYNDSMYAEGTDKQGIVVVTGITTWDGQLSSGVNGNGTQINYGFPYMIQDATNGGFCQGAFASSALGRANLVDGTKYRVIMGFTGSGSAITLHWYLYNLDTSEVVEQSSMTTWNFFTGSDSAVGNMTINDLSGSIVLYGKFGVDCTLDTVYSVFEDTTLDAVASGLLNNEVTTVKYVDEDGRLLQQETLDFGATPSYKGETPTKESTLLYQYTFNGWEQIASEVEGEVVYRVVFAESLKDGITSDNATTSGDSITLGVGSIGAGANYTIGQNAGGSITQSYFAFDGDYGFDDYIVFDFTGKNMPEVMFFADNYDTSMYYSEGKQGIVVASGITLWDGSIGSAQTNNTKVGVSGPFGAYFEGAAAPYGGNMMSDFAAGLARANLVDGTQYRIIMGMQNNGTTFTLHYMLYNLTKDEQVEQVSQTSWAFFTGSNAAVNNMTLDGLSGAIVLYGKFNTTATIDKFWGVYEDTNLTDVALAVFGTGDSGDSGEGGDTSVSNAPDYSKYTDQFDFYAYSCYSDGTYEIDGVKYYIGKNLANLKQYSLYGDVGMTIYFPQSDYVISDDASTVTRAKALIDDLAKVGITKTILQDNRILHLSLQETAIVGSGAQFADEAALDAYIYNCVKDYATYPGVYGIQLGDEPKYACLSAYAAVYNSIKRVNEKYGFNLFIQYNLNPLNVTETVYTNYYPASSGTYAWGNYRYTLGIRDRFTDCVTRYTQYINDFLNAMNPDSIMYDDYPLRENADGELEILDSYIPCLQIVAKAAADRNIKFYHVTQAHKNNAEGSVHKRAVTEAGAKWINNILLGFGAKQIAYYTYYTRSESDSTGGESYVDGESFVDYNGNTTALYSTMKGILANNQKFAPTILQFDYKGSRVYGSTSENHLGEITVSNSFTKLSACSVNTGSALVTELYDDENDNYMYMAMNVLDPDASTTSETVTMTFSGYTHVLVYVDGVATEVALSSGVYTATLAPGEAVYVIPYNN